MTALAGFAVGQLVNVRVCVVVDNGGRVAVSVVPDLAVELVNTVCVASDSGFAVALGLLWIFAEVVEPFEKGFVVGFVVE